MVLLMLMMAATCQLVINSMTVGQNSRLKQIATDIAADTLDCAVASLNVAVTNFPTPCGEPEQLVKALNGFSGVGIIPALYQSATPAGTVTRGGTTFAVEQEVEPGSGTCGIPNGGAPPELQVVDWVTWANGVTVNPPYWWLSLPNSVSGRYVQETTVVAVPAIALNPNYGSIKVQITDDAQNGQRDLQVTATDTNTNQVYTARTTDLGCALFLNMPPDPYTVSVSPIAGTYVDSNDDMAGGVPAPLAGPNMNGNVQPSATLSVPSAKPLYYTGAAYVNATYTPPASFQGLTWAQPYVTVQNDLATSMPLSFWNNEPNGLTTSPYVAAAPPAAGDPVFPFQASTPSYYVAAGSCGADSSPDGFSGGNPNDGVPVPGSGPLAAGQVATASFTLEPSAVAVLNGTTDVGAGAVVEARAATSTGGSDSNCPTSGSAVMPILQLGATSSAPVPQPGGNTVTVVSSSANPSISGTQVTFTATVNAVSPAIGVPGGTVTFYENGTSIGTGTLNPSWSLPSGSWVGVATSPPVVLTNTGSPYSITATYGGSASPNFSSSTSATLSQAVEPTGQGYAITTNTLASSATTSLSGTAVTFTATVGSAGNASPSTGTVTFTCTKVTGTSCSSSGTVIGTATPTNGIATITQSVGFTTGKYSITAQYAAGVDGDFTSSTASPPLTQTVVASPADATTTTINSSANPSALGQAVTFVATVNSAYGSPSGTVVFKDGSNPITCASPLSNATVANGVATCTPQVSTLSPGPNSITATFTPTDPNYAASSTSTALTQQVVANDTLSSLPDGYFLLWAQSQSGSLVSTHTTTAIVLKVLSVGTTAGVWESTCTGGSYSSPPYYTLGTGICTSFSQLSPGAIIAVPVS